MMQKLLLAAALLLAPIAAYAQYFPATNKVTLLSTGTVQTSGAALANTVATYASGTVVGGPIQFLSAVNAPVANSSGVTVGQCAHINKVNIISKTAGLSPTFYILLFGKPLTGTYTDNTTFNLNAADVPLARLITDPTWVSGGTGGSLGQTSDTTQDICNTVSTPTSTIYALIVTASATYTPASTSDLAGNVSFQGVTE